MKLVTSNGLLVLYDKEDHALISKYTWRVAKTGKKFYVIADTKSGKPIYMHRLILGLKRGDPRMSDHKNGCTVDNRRRNLRIATAKQNAWNVKKSKSNLNNYPGVVKHKSGRYQARIRIGGKRVSLGYFDTAKQAARAYAKKQSTVQREILVA